LIDVADPVEPFSAGRFAGLATQAIETARSAGQTPIVVGGTISASRCCSASSAAAARRRCAPAGRQWDADPARTADRLRA
jgi:tRNA A37 N6-isopentenylltransferase MiaA